MTFSHSYLLRCPKSIRYIWNAQFQFHHCLLEISPRHFSTALCRSNVLVCSSQQPFRLQNVIAHECEFSPLVRKKGLLAFSPQHPILWKSIILSYSTQQPVKIGDSGESGNQSQKINNECKEEQALSQDSKVPKKNDLYISVEDNSVEGISEHNFETDFNKISKKVCVDKNNKLKSINLPHDNTSDFENLVKNESLPKEPQKHLQSKDIKSDKTESNVETSHIPVNLMADASKSIEAGKMASETLPSRLMRFFFWRYWWYLQKFQERVEQKMPKTFKLFRLFGTGFKDFSIDFLDYVKLLVRLSLPSVKLNEQTYRNLQLYHYMPWDMLRVSPMLIISAIPFGQNVAIPVSFFFPRHLLSYHFWTLQQRREFSAIKLRKRLFNARPVFRYLQSHIYTIKEPDDREKFQRVFFKLGSGIHPTTKEIIELLPTFRDKTYHLNAIYSAHVNALLRLHGMSALFHRRGRLYDYARIIHCMDEAIMREGGVNKLSQNQLYQCLFLRGISPTNMRAETMIQKMEEWLTVSKEIDKDTYSLLLHLPIFLAYNEPTNLILIS